MAARAKAPAAAQATQPTAWVEEGRGWLYRVKGWSPAWGASLTVYALLPELVVPSSLERLAGLFSGGARFEADEIWVEELPFSARGHVVVKWPEGRVFPAVREEVRRRLEEHRVRRLTVVLRGYGLEGALPLEDLLRLREELRRLRLGFEVARESEEGLFERLEEEVERVREELEGEGRVLGPWNSMVQRCYEKCMEEARRVCFGDRYLPYEECLAELEEECGEVCLEEYGG